MLHQYDGVCAAHQRAAALRAARCSGNRPVFPTGRPRYKYILNHSITPLGGLHYKQHHPTSPNITQHHPTSPSINLKFRFQQSQSMSTESEPSVALDGFHFHIGAVSRDQGRIDFNVFDRPELVSAVSACLFIDQRHPNSNSITGCLETSSLKNN